MSIYKLQLNKLVSLLYADQSMKNRKLREDIRSDIAKSDGNKQKGGHFHEPFWRDAKNHVNGINDLRESTQARISSNRNRRRLYPLLRDGFLDWWDNKRRWTNEQSKSELLSIKGSVVFEELKSEVKVSNLLALTIGSTEKRIIYPYFSEEPVMNDDSARIALGIMMEALPDQVPSELRVLDVIRGKSYSPQDVVIDGTELFIARTKYKKLIEQWETLRETYKAA